MGRPNISSVNRNKRVKHLNVDLFFDRSCSTPICCDLINLLTEYEQATCLNFHVEIHSFSSTGDSYLLLAFSCKIDLETFRQTRTFCLLFRESSHKVVRRSALDTSLHFWINQKSETQ